MPIWPRLGPLRGRHLGSREDASRNDGGDSRAEDIVGIKRLVDLGEPFGTVSSAAAAAFVERQFQLAQQAGDFLAGRDMAHAWPGAERRLVEVVERGQPARKK